MKKIYLAALLPSILLLSGCWWQQDPSNGGEKTPVNTGSSSGTIKTEAKTHTIEMTASGFSPAAITINMGDSVKFVNNDISLHWPASANHPSHTVYPGSDIEKCGTPEASGIFDACRWLLKNESYSFTFNQKWTWGYHDHLNAGLFGKITVEDPQSNIIGNGETRTGSVMYFPGKPEYSWYLATPGTSGKHPALILIHEWWGLNDNIKALARDFADKWYVVLAVDMYGKLPTTDSQEAMKMAGVVTANTNQAFQNLNYAVQYLKSNPDVDGTKLGSVGWCFGGGWAYQMAKNDLGTRASIMYYGQFNPKDDLSMMRSDILGHFGEKDTSISIDNVNEFQAKLKTLSGSSMVYIYPNAGHGFANESGANYDKTAADLAWQRTLDFLEKYVKSE